MNMEVLETQRALLLEQLAEVEKNLVKAGFKKNKQGFTLFLRNGIYYVKYYDFETGLQVPTNRSLDTADRKEAEFKAKRYRESILKDYYDKKNKIKDIYTLFDEYYDKEKSKYLQEVLKTGQRKINDKQIKNYYYFIKKYFTSFLKKKKITKINHITINILREFQTFLVENKLTPKSINNYLNGAVKPIFTNLLLKGVINETPFIAASKFNLTENGKTKRYHILPIYETLAVLLNADMWKVFKKKEDIAANKNADEKKYKKYRLLCLIMATTGLRNAEIFLLKKENIIKIRRTYFLNVENSHTEEEGLKTENAKRKVPIPDITLKALNEYITENNITDYLFHSGKKIKNINASVFNSAKNHFGIHCGYTENELKEKNFVFYSLRHFYKTMLNRSSIKNDIIEYFMGHAVNVKNMAENYNNKEDLDDYFFETEGLKVIEYVNDLFKKVMKKYDLLPVYHTHIEQVSLTDNKNNKTNVFYTEVLNKIDFNEEIYLFIADLQDKNLLPNTTDKTNLIIGLEKLLAEEKIDKRRFDDCVYYIKNILE